MKIKWKVQAAESGRYRSFAKRGWPQATWTDKEESPAGQIRCEDEYEPSKVKAGHHGLLTVYIADHSVSPWTWWKLRTKFGSLADAKVGLAQAYEKFPHYKPVERPAGLHDKVLEDKLMKLLTKLERDVDAIGPTALRHELDEHVVAMKNAILKFDQDKYEEI